MFLFLIIWTTLQTSSERRTRFSGVIANRSHLIFLSSQKSPRTTLTSIILLLNSPRCWEIPKVRLKNPVLEQDPGMHLKICFSSMWLKKGTTKRKKRSQTISITQRKELRVMDMLSRLNPKEMFHLALTKRIKRSISIQIVKSIIFEL